MSVTNAASTSTNPQAPLADFEKTTSFWGPLTMIAGLLAMLSGPVFLAIFGGYDIQPAHVVTAVVAIAAVFGIVWFIEPISYFPILGPAAMYQAFLIGNISTKLLPAAMAAQTRIRAEPGSPRAQIAATAAICAAGLIHVAALVLCVGVLGTWLLSAIPAGVLVAVTKFVVPAILGGVLVQLIQNNLQNKALLAVGVLSGAVVVFVILPLFPALGIMVTLLGVVLTVGLALLLPSKDAANPAK